MVLPATRLTVELIPHCTSVTRDGWTGSHGVRPLAALGLRQAEALVPVTGAGVDGIYSSPAVRCRQTVGPLAVAPAPAPSPRTIRFRPDRGPGLAATVPKSGLVP
jgi:broad specificity phosphatase PhoE